MSWKQNVTLKLPRWMVFFLLMLMFANVCTHTASIIHKRKYLEMAKKQSIKECKKLIKEM